MITFFVTDDAEVKHFDTAKDCLRLMRSGDLWKPLISAGYDVEFFEDKSSGVVTFRAVPPIKKSSSK